MSQVDSAGTEKTCLSHVYDTNSYNQDILSSKIGIRSVVLIVAFLGLNSTFV